MKKWMSFFLTLALLCLPMTALAAGGNVILTPEDDSYINRIMAMDGKICWCDYSSLTIYDVETGETQKYSLNPDYSSYGDYVYSTGDTYLVNRNGELWYLTVLAETQNDLSTIRSGFLAKIEINGDAASLTDVQDFEWPVELIDSYGGDEFPVNLNGEYIINDVLYVLTGLNDFYALDLNTGRIEMPYADEVTVLVPYTDGTLLLGSSDYSTSSASLTVYDPSSDSTQSLADISLNDLTGFTADPESGTVYGLSSGSVCAVDLSTGEMGEEIASVPLSAYSDVTAWMLKGRYYALNCDSGVVVRDLQSTVQVEHHLTIYDGAWSDSVSSAVLTFSNNRGDVEVAQSHDYSGSNVIEDMMNQNGDTDIFVLSTSTSIYESLHERGFLAELNSDKINELMKNVYPSVLETLSANGELVAVPVQCQYNTLSFSESVLEKLGMTIDDIPTNWSDFLDFLINTLPAKLEGTDVTLSSAETTVSGMKYQLAEMILADYQNYANTMMDTPSYNTELLQSLFSKLDQVDFEALGLSPDSEEGGISITYGNGNDTELMNPYDGACFDSFWNLSYSTPVVMSLDADTPAIMALDVSVAVINPYSDDIDTAREFLECLADELPTSLMYNFDTTLTEPVRSKYADEEEAYYQKAIEDCRKRLETASDADKQAIEEELQEIQENYENSEENRWDISQKQMDWFRSNDDNVICEPVNWLYSDSTGEAYQLFGQYVQGQIDINTFLSGMDQKVRMMQLEGN